MGYIAELIGSFISTKLNGHQSKEIQRMDFRPCLSIKMVVPPDDGIGGVPVKYCLKNIGKNNALNPEVVEVFRTVDGVVQEGKPVVPAIEYNIIGVDSEVEFYIDWEHRNILSFNPEESAENEIMEKLIKEYQEAPKRLVVDNIVIHFRDLLDNKYSQVATVKYNHPDKPFNIDAQMTAPELI